MQWPTPCTRPVKMEGMDRAGTDQTRCAWCVSHPLYIQYHDEEWGVPVHEDQRLFEMLALEGAQAGLSWLTILRKREGYRLAFDAFDVERIAAYRAGEIERLLADPGIVRNRLKIESVIRNARGVLKIREELGSLDAFRLALCRWPTSTERVAVHGGAAGQDRSVRPYEQGPEAARFQFCRFHRVLCVHAGRRHGERSRDRLFPTSRGVTPEPTRMIRPQDCFRGDCLRNDVPP